MTPEATLLEILTTPGQLPKSDIPDLKGRLMSIIWRMEVERIDAKHPGARQGAIDTVKAIQDHYDRGGTEEDAPSFHPFAKLAMSAMCEHHSWELNGCPWIEFVLRNPGGAISPATHYVWNESSDPYSEDGEE